MLDLVTTAIFHVTSSQCLDTFPFYERNMTQDYLDANHMAAVCGSLYTCVTLPMYLANIQNPEVYKKMKKILMKMGKLYQIQVSKH